MTMRAGTLKALTALVPILVSTSVVAAGEAQTSWERMNQIPFPWKMTQSSPIVA